MFSPTNTFQNSFLSQLSRSFCLFASLLAMTFCISAQATELKVGDQAPDFKLQATDGQFYQLSDYLGKQAVVLAWFPKANTHYCTLECKSLVDNGEQLRKFDMQYFMASVDPLEDNADFAEKTKADFPMLSDSEKTTAKAYGVLSFFGHSDRVTFYISKEGKILFIDADVHAKTAAQDMIENLQDLQVAMKAPQTLTEQPIQTAEAE